MTTINDMEDLEDMLHTLVFEDEPSIFTEEYAVELVETALHLMEEFVLNEPNVFSKPNFHEILLEGVKDIFYAQLEEHIDDIDIGDDIEDDMNELLEEAFNIYITTFHPERSIFNDDTKNNNENINENEVNLDLLFGCYKAFL